MLAPREPQTGSRLVGSALPAGASAGERRTFAAPKLRDAGPARDAGPPRWQTGGAFMGAIVLLALVLLGACGSSDQGTPTMDASPADDAGRSLVDGATPATDAGETDSDASGNDAMPVTDAGPPLR